MVSSYCLRKNVENVYKKLLSNISNAFGDIYCLQVLTCRFTWGYLIFAQKKYQYLMKKE